jgi:hypothetical protein
MPAAGTVYLVVRRDDGFGDVFPLTPGQSLEDPAFRLETCGTLGVMPPHVVQKAVAMSDVRGLHRLEFGSGMLRALGALGYDIESSRRGISRSTP